MAKSIQNNLGRRVGIVHKLNHEYRKRVSHWNLFNGKGLTGWIFDEIELKQLLVNKAKVVHLIDAEDNHYEMTLDDCIYHCQENEKSGKHGTFFVVPLEKFEQAYKNYPKAV